MEPNPTQAVIIEVMPDPRPDVQILKLHGPLTIHNYYDFQDLTRKQPLPRLLFVDLSDVPYIDSAALGSFVGIHVSCEGTDRKYALVGSNDRLKNLFDLAYVRAFLVIYDSLAEAQAHLV